MQKRMRNQNLEIVILKRRGTLEENKEILDAYKNEIDEESSEKRKEKIQKKLSNIYVKQIKLMNEL